MASVVSLLKKNTKSKLRKDGPIGIMYVEVNSNNFLNVGCYTLSSTGEQLFDIGIIFAANIKYVQQQKHTLWLNNNVTTLLNGADRYIRPLQEKGIKVLLSVLGGGEGAGVCNFENSAAAYDFALQCHEIVRLFDLDGIDFDDEYAEYGQHPGPGAINSFSFLFLLRELRDLMPDKIITFYYYGPASQRLSYDDLIAGSFLDYSYNAIYGSYSPPNVPGLDRSQVGPAAVWVNVTAPETSQNLATRTVEEGYGVYLMYDLPNTDINNYMSGICSRLYGTTCNLEDQCLQTWPSSSSDPSVLLPPQRLDVKSIDTDPDINPE